MENPVILLGIASEADRTVVQNLARSCGQHYAFDVAQDVDDLRNKLRTEMFYCAIVESDFAAPANDLAGGPTPIVWIVSEEDKTVKDGERQSSLHWLKGQLEPALFKHVLPIFVQCHNMRQQLNRHSAPFEKRNLDQEIASLMNWYYRTSVTASSYGVESIREALPEQHKAMLENFCKLIDRTMDQRFFKTESHTSTDLRELAELIGTLNGGPRDIIELYSSALRAKAKGTSTSRAKVIADISRTLALELMGYLVAHYRRKCRSTMKTIAGSVDESKDA